MTRQRQMCGRWEFSCFTCYAVEGFYQGYLPYFDENLADLYSKIIFEDLEIPSHINKEAANLLRKILERTPKDRISLEEILDHPWMVLRKLFAQDLDELDWDVEYNLARSEAIGSILATILVYFSYSA